MKMSDRGSALNYKSQTKNNYKGVILIYSVYIHTNRINQKRYVGMTSQPVERRWKNGYGYSEKLPIGRAIRKYGWENFGHDVILDGLNEDAAKFFERGLIELMETQNPKYGYNLCSGGDGISGYHFSEETKKKQSESAKALNRFGNKNPNYGNRWTDEMRKKLSEKLKVTNQKAETRRARSEAAKKRTGEMNPFYGKTHSDETKKLLSKIRSRSVKQYDLNGNFIKEHDSIKNASRETGICKVAISNCCRGKSKTSGGFIWEYSNKE